MDNYSMAKKILKIADQVVVLTDLAEHRITVATAAELMDLTVRQVRNKLKTFKAEGKEGLIHKNTGKPGRKRLSPSIEAFVIGLLKGPVWYDFGPTFTAEKLKELHGITVSKETVRRIMMKHGVSTTGGRKKRRIQQRRLQREPKPMFGIMIQLDGSPHKWLGEDNPSYSLLVFIDDATSQIVWLHLADSESVESLMTGMRNYIEKFGRPISIYVDFGGVFSVNTNNKERTKITQFERAMKELSIKVIHAHSPQAKGRVERSHGTHQDRLVNELRLRGITGIDEANKFLPSYIEGHNKKFARLPTEAGDAHRSIKRYNLDEIFCLHEERILQNDYTLRYKNRILQLMDDRNIQYRPKDAITIKERFDGSINLFIRGHRLEHKELKARPKKEIVEKIYSDPKLRPVSKASRRWNDGGGLKSRLKEKRPNEATVI